MDTAKKIISDEKPLTSVMEDYLEAIFYLAIEKKVVDEEACKMEHTLSAGTLDSLTDFMAFIQVCPRVGEDWLGCFEAYRA